MDKYRDSEVGKILLTHCSGKCNKVHYHKVLGHILTYEDLGEIEEKEEPEPDFTISPTLVDPSVEEGTGMVDGEASVFDEEPKEETPE